MAEPIEDLPTRTFDPGAVIFREGDESQSEAYLVHEGTVEARRRVDGQERVLNTLVKGDLLGEVALFRNAQEVLGHFKKTSSRVSRLPLVYRKCLTRL